ncbi:hypothetical protein BDY21DRAFT_285362 [Lineolata rhizophorae]|uniref:Integral membrane protein n=1 Tax=Lineolata rhizophorae TaxID=578093 RepID=A0A6A6P2S5_9PEZI|nr:hypothetical protein BDY21DRAFT_285362 [Lineolata rhizophorae]
MGSNTFFHEASEPLQNHAALQILPDHVTGPFSYLNPTQIRFRVPDGGPAPGQVAEATEPRDSVTYIWSSRNNRKGRHAVVLDGQAVRDGCVEGPAPTATIRETLRGLKTMFTQFPVWDISYLVAIIFTLGSVIWVINAFFVWLPLVRPETEFPNEELTGGGVTAFVGATVFEIGSVLLLLEAINENRTGCFGWALERVLSGDHVENGGTMRCLPEKTACHHHHLNRRNLMKANDQSPKKRRTWLWWPSWSDLRTHFLHQIGFLASLSQFIGATIFWIAGFTALPGIYNHMSTPLMDGIFWTPQVVGGTGFIISGTLFMVETQEKWWKPTPGTLGWWVGAWNLVGGVGFTICPAFGYDTSSWAQYQSSLSTFWGSWAFLIGSCIQWFESLAKNPVEVTK